MSADVYADMKQGEKGAWISIAAYIVLSGVKLMIGWMYQSQALQADGWNNLTDIIASLAVLIGLRISQKPPDRDHPYGHLRAETIAALIASFIMATVGIQVILSTAGSWFAGEEAARARSPAGWRWPVRLLCLPYIPTISVSQRESATRRLWLRHRTIAPTLLSVSARRWASSARNSE